MKGIMLIGVTLLASGCCTTDVVEYRQVVVTPIVAPPVVEPVVVDTGYYDPLDVTTTTIDFY